MDLSAQAVLRKYSRAVLALRGAHRDARLGLMLGAGVSRAFDFGDGTKPPSWQELVAMLEDHIGFDASDPSYKKLSLTLRVEVLFRAFAARRGADSPQPSGSTAAVGEWRELVRQYLYRGAPGPDQLVSSHPFIGSMAQLVLDSPMTVTYNFDSYLEQVLSTQPRAAAGSEARGRGFESISDVAMPQRLTRGVVYHINGYLPRNTLEQASDQLVFSEGDFSSQLMMTMAGRYATVAHHLINSVYLLIGLSLDDPNLRHLLRTNALLSPGRVHFVVRHVAEAKEPSELTEAEQRVADVGFDLHNLCTLFLTADEIAALCRLIAMDTPMFVQLAQSAGVDAKLVYYLTGIPGIGKTTILRHMGGLYALDEWLEAPNELLSRPHSDLLPDERDHLDRWVAQQFKAKNDFLRRLDEGIFVVERGPLDPLAFEAADRVAAKADSYVGELGLRFGDGLQPGQVVMLRGDTLVVERRIAKRQATVQTSSYLNDLQAQICSLYDMPAALSWESTDWSVEELVRQFASLVYRGEYCPSDLQSRILAIARTQATPPDAG